MDVSVLCVFYSNDKRQNARQSGQRTTDKAQRENSGKKIPVEARFSVPVHTDPGGPLSLIYNGYRISFPRINRPGRGVNRPPPSSAEVKETVELYLCSPSGPSWPVIGRTLPLPFFFTKVVFRACYWPRPWSADSSPHFCVCNLKYILTVFGVVNRQWAWTPWNLGLTSSNGLKMFLFSKASRPVLGST
jgi:hypothetical protein